MNINELNKKGYRVKIRHFRRLKAGPIVEPQTIDLFLTRGEFERYKKENVPFYNGSSSLVVKQEELKFGEIVDPHGGFTIAELINENTGEILYGKYNFNNRNFQRKVGFAAAVGRALLNDKTNV